MSITNGNGDFTNSTLRRLAVGVIAACLVLASCGGEDNYDTTTPAPSTTSEGGDDVAAGGPVAVPRQDPPAFPLDGFAAEAGAEVWTVTDGDGQGWTVVTTTEPSAYVTPAGGGSCDDLDPAVLAAIPDWDVAGPWACY